MSKYNPGDTFKEGLYIVKVITNAPNIDVENKQVYFCELNLKEYYAYVNYDEEKLDTLERI